MAKPQHHIRQEVCFTRAPYREGRKPTAVKVYTIHNESKYLLVQGIPMVGAANELVQLFEVHGDIDEHKMLDDYPCEQFTETHLIKYKKIQSARFAKRKLDDWSFYGGVLHVCYAPEFETIGETREKLTERRRVVESKIRQYRSDGTYTGSMCIQQRVQSSLSGEKSNKTYKNISHSLSANSNTEKHSFNRNMLDSVTKFNPNYLNDNHLEIQTTDKHAAGINVQYGSQQMQSENHQSGSNYSYNSVQNSSANDVPWSVSRMTDIAKHSVPVQQAESLRYYGTQVHDFKIPRKQAQGSLNPIDQEKGEAVIDDIDNSNDEQLFLPTPPKQMKTNADTRHRPKNDVARVPSAQACFPANFDARIAKDTTMETTVTDNDERETQEKTLQQQVEDSLKSKDVVIKQFNRTGSVPKFVPRQALIKKRHELDSRSTEKVTDVLNNEIRTNAFKLGKVQGPADNGPCTSNENLDSKERTVIDSVQHIRKRLAQVKEIKTTDEP